MIIFRNINISSHPTMNDEKNAIAVWKLRALVSQKCSFIYLNRLSTPSINVSALHINFWLLSLCCSYKCSFMDDLKKKIDAIHMNHLFRDFNIISGVVSWCQSVKHPRNGLLAPIPKVQDIWYYYFFLSLQIWQNKYICGSHLKPHHTIWCAVIYQW